MEPWTSIPYGRPLANQLLRVVNNKGKDSPVGVPGELWIGGYGVAEGYVNEEKLTQERFVKIDGIRWYKTGDKAQYFQDGNVQFLGRLDDQVKVNGYRIELGEIENVIKRAECIDAKKILAQTILFYMNKKGVLLKDIPCTLNQILKCLSVNTDNNDIIYRWIELLKKYNYVTETDGIYVCKIEIYEKGLKYGWEEVEYLWKGKLESPLVLDYIINNIKNWDKLIQKEQQATLLLFEQGEDIYAHALYKETKILQYLNHSLSKKVLGYLHENANATILEIGAGTGATSNKVLSDIRENKFEEHIVYFYTDISRFFLQRAKERYKECDGKIEMHHQTLDIDEAFSSQLPSNFQADIVIAVGVLNNSVNTDKCIYEINSVMKPGGILLVIETVEDVPDILITQSFMMTAPKDRRKATNTMFLNRKQWLEILEENGFCNSEEFPGYGEYLEVLGQKLFYCTKE